MLIEKAYAAMISGGYPSLSGDVAAPAAPAGSRRCWGRAPT